MSSLRVRSVEESASLSVAKWTAVEALFSGGTVGVASGVAIAIGNNEEVTQAVVCTRDHERASADTR